MSFASLREVLATRRPPILGDRDVRHAIEQWLQQRLPLQSFTVQVNERLVTVRALSPAVRQVVLTLASEIACLVRDELEAAPRQVRVTRW